MARIEPDPNLEDINEFHLKERNESDGLTKYLIEHVIMLSDL